MYFICSSWLFTRIFSAKIALKNRSTIFTLGSRGNVLTSELEEPVIVPHAAQKTEKKVWGASFWMKKKTLTKKEETNKNQRRRRLKIQDRVHPFFFFCNANLSCNFILYENRKYIYFHTSLAPPSSLVHRIELQRNRGIWTVWRKSQTTFDHYSLLTPLNPNRD